MTIDCTQCPLRQLDVFSPFTGGEEAFMKAFKAGELQIETGAQAVLQGARSPHLYTVLSGVGIRYATLEDGRRQILNFVFPGDLVGLQGALMDAMSHSVEAKTAMTLCVFPRERLWELFKTSSSRAYDVTWLAAREERLLSDNLVSLGRLSGLERVAHVLQLLHTRYVETGLAEGDSVALHFTQAEIADSIGLTPVHTNRLMKKLREEGLISTRDGALTVLAPEALAALAKIDPARKRERPLI